MHAHVAVFLFPAPCFTNSSGVVVERGARREKEREGGREREWEWGNKRWWEEEGER